MTVKMAHFLRSRTWQPTMICLFNDYDLPLPCESFITMTHLGQEKWAVGFKRRSLSLSDPGNGSRSLSDSQPWDPDGSFSSCLIFHPHPFCWMDFVLYLSTVCQMVRLSLTQNGSQVRAGSLWDAWQRDMLSISQLPKTISGGKPWASPVYLASEKKKFFPPKDEEWDVTVDFVRVYRWLCNSTGRKAL